MPAGLDIVATPPAVERPNSDEIYELMTNSAIFSMLTPDELHHLARTALTIEVGPMERIIVRARKDHHFSLWAMASSRFLCARRTASIT